MRSKLSLLFLSLMWGTWLYTSVKAQTNLPKHATTKWKVTSQTFFPKMLELAELRMMYYNDSLPLNPRYLDFSVMKIVVKHQDH